MEFIVKNINDFINDNFFEVLSMMLRPFHENRPVASDLKVEFDKFYESYLGGLENAR